MSQLSSLLWTLAANTTLRATTLASVNADLNLVALPRLAAGRFTLSNLDFKQRISVEHFTPLMFQSCRFAAESQIHSQGPIMFHDCDQLPSRIIAHDQSIEIARSKTGDTFETIEITGKSKASFTDCKFTTASSSPVFQLKNAENVEILNCQFANLTTHAIVSTDSLLRLVSTEFANLTADEGAALVVDGGHVKASACVFTHCEATKRAGAVLIKPRARLVIFERCVFALNKAPIGRSISVDGAADISFTRFSGSIEDEVEGKNYLAWGSQFLMGGNLAALPPPSLVVPTQSPFPTVTATPNPTVPLPTVDNRPTATPIPPSENPGAKKTMIVFVSVICAVIVVVVVVVVVVFLIRKKKSQIYPESDDGDFAKEPERTTVIVKNLYAVNTVIP